MSILLFYEVADAYWNTLFTMEKPKLPFATRPRINLKDHVQAVGDLLF
jgi:hypothetical protein